MITTRGVRVACRVWGEGTRNSEALVASKFISCFVGVDGCPILVGSKIP